MSQVLTMNLFLYVSVLLVFLSGTLPNAEELRWLAEHLMAETGG